VKYTELEKCIEVVKALRHPQTGCPWDLVQTHESLLKYLIEESYEFIEAVEIKNPQLMEEEIGDVLLQVLLHTTIGEEKGSFSLESSARKLTEKLIRRHPHVFKESDSTLSPDQVLLNWQKIKISEKGIHQYSLNEKLLHAPSLESAYRIGKMSKEFNFDWDNYQQVIIKVEEEWQEVREEIKPESLLNKERIKEEIGDLLFSISQLARHLDLNPEDCLREANKKFIKRINQVEDMAKASGESLKEAKRSSLEEYWMKVKSIESSVSKGKT
jgi:MazG family protein